MRVLSVTNPNSLNPYPREIYEYLESGYDISIDESLVKFFLPGEYDYDIIHIHWPNGLKSNPVNPNFLIGTGDFNPEIYTVRESLAKWKKKAKIVFTRHNDKPHEGQSEFHFLLEQLITQYADVVIHLGSYSKDSYMKESNIPGQLNRVIPHHMYACYENETSRQTSRNKLRIKDSTLVVLIFGAVRNIEEMNFALQVFKQVEPTNKLLMAPRWYVEDFSIYGGFSRLYKTNLKKIKDYLRSRKYRLGNFRTSILDPDVQYYFNAADIVLIPRLDALNSGVIPLAYAFKKPVIGPGVGNLTELLEASGNSPFQPGDHAAAAVTINELIKNRQVDAAGQRNYEYGSEHLHLEVIGKKHFDLYSELMNSR